MPGFLITTQSRTQFNGIRIEHGMSVEVVTRDAGVSSPVYLEFVKEN